MKTSWIGYVIFAAFGFFLLTLLYLCEGCVEDPRHHKPGESWAEIKMAQEECEQMCADIDAWCHRYRHYNTEKCICKDADWNYYHVTNEGGTLIVSPPSKKDFGN